MAFRAARTSNVGSFRVLLNSEIPIKGQKDKTGNVVNAMIEMLENGNITKTNHDILIRNIPELIANSNLELAAWEGFEADEAAILKARRRPILQPDKTLLGPSSICISNPYFFNLFIEATHWTGFDICWARFSHISAIERGILAWIFWIIGNVGLFIFRSSKTNFNFVVAISIKLEWEGTETARSIILFAPFSFKSFLTDSISSALPAITVWEG